MISGCYLVMRSSQPYMRCGPKLRLVQGIVPGRGMRAQHFPPSCCQIKDREVAFSLAICTCGATSAALTRRVVPPDLNKPGVCRRPHAGLIPPALRRVRSAPGVTFGYSLRLSSPPDQPPGMWSQLSILVGPPIVLRLCKMPGGTDAISVASEERNVQGHPA